MESGKYKIPDAKGAQAEKKAKLIQLPQFNEATKINIVDKGYSMKEDFEANDFYHRG